MASMILSYFSIRIKTSKKYFRRVQSDGDKNEYFFGLL